jgi:hypothetical protein
VQYSYGLFHSDGTPKPAVANLTSTWASATVDRSFNNSFEQVDERDSPTIWEIWYPAYGAFARDATVSWSGTASARLSHTSGTPDGNPAVYATPIDAIVPQQTYTATARVRGVAATGASYVALGWFDREGRYLKTDASPLLPSGTTDWTLLSVSAPAPEASAFVEIHLGSAYNEGTVWFDDVTFEHGAP